PGRPRDELRRARGARSCAAAALRGLRLAGGIVLRTHRDRHRRLATTTPPGIDPVRDLRRESLAGFWAAEPAHRTTAGPQHAAAARRALVVCRPRHAAAVGRVAGKVWSSRVAAVLAVDARAELARVNVPMLYLRARKDRLIPAS